MLGDYWACLHRDKSTSVPMFLEDFEKFVVMDGGAPTPKDVDYYEYVVPMEYSAPPLDVLIWVGVDESGKGCVHSNYPYIRDGGITEITIAGVRPWEKNIEGLVYGKIDDFSIAFFDALFPISWDRYVVGETIPVSLSGLGKSVHRLSTVAEVMNDPGNRNVQDAIEHVLMTGESKFMSLHFVEAKHNIDDLVMVFGKVLDHSVSLIHEVKLHRIAISLMDGLTIPIVFGETSIDTPNWQPAAGEFIAITFFLQGYRLALKLKPSTARQ